MDFFQAKNGIGKLVYYESRIPADINQYYEDHKDEIKSIIGRFGGILLRNFTIRSISEFSKFSTNVSSGLVEYIHRSTPRTHLGKKLYTATEYPNHKHILLHNENSYTLQWPDLIMFFCAIPSTIGGETPIADSRHVYSKLDPKILSVFNEKKVLYERNYVKGIDLSWQEVFQTAEKKRVETYCNKNNIHYVWHDKNSDGLELTTKQICQASIQHPITKDYVWFNQAHLFHPISLEEVDKKALYLIGRNFMPRNVFYGDGSEIDERDIQHILDTYESEKISFQWKRGDVLILDNRLMAHARSPYSGERKVIVAMGSF